MNRFNNVIFGQKAFIIRNGKILILKRKDADVFSGFWDVPGGKLESDEGLINGIAREIKEESGLILIRILLTLSTSRIQSTIRDCPLIFRNIYLCSAKGKVELSNEHSDYIWVLPEKLVCYKFPNDNDIQSSLKRIPIILKEIDKKIDYSVIYD